MYAGIAIIANSSHAANRDVCSTCSYTTIQDAVDHAASDDVIRIASGTYVENIAMSRTGWNLHFRGGYDNAFTTREGESILEGYLFATVFNSGSVVVDGLTIRNSPTQGILSTSTNTDFIITNCKIHNNASYGIWMYDAGDVTITGNDIYSNGSYGGISVDRHSGSGGNTVISGNSIHNNACAYCVGISLGWPTSNDIISDNLIYANQTGISSTAQSTTAATLINKNTIYSNTVSGIYVSSGAFTITNNIIRNNGARGVYYASTNNSSILNNVLAYNGTYGIHFVSGDGSPHIRNNIFYEEQYGLYFSGNDGGYGTSNVIPSEVSHNNFYHDRMVHYSLLMAFNTEEPGAYGDINSLAWSDSNTFIDPRFIDPENNDYRLQADSFLIDEGYASDDYSSEPAPNGGRINIGAYGGTINAETAPSAPSISNLSSAQSGNDVIISFDTNSSVHDLWATFEYWDGAMYHAISPPTLSSGNYSVGYRTGRLVAGSSQTITWNNTNTLFAGLNITSKIRLTLQHGNDTTTGVSGNFAIDYSSTPTPTPSPTVTITPTATHTITPTPYPTEAPTQTPAITSIPTATAEPTSTPPSERPLIKTSNSSRKQGMRIKLPIMIEDRDSLSVTVFGSIKVKRKSVVLRHVTMTLPRNGKIKTDFGPYKIKKGRYKYCLTAIDDTNLKSAPSCSWVTIKNE